MFENSSQMKTPSSLIFAVPEDMHLLLRKAGYLSGEIIPVPRNAGYSENPKETQIVNEEIENFVLSKSVYIAG